MKRSKRIVAVLLSFVTAVSMAGSVFAGSAVQDADYVVDVVVIGAGAAGMPAALAATESGVTNILLIESQSHVGGTGLMAWGGITAANTRYQSEPDTWEDMAYAARGLGQTNVPYMIEIVAEGSADSLHWLNDLGVGFTNQTGLRAHNTGGTVHVGTALTRGLYNAVADAGIPLMLNTRATEILVDDDGNVTGIVAERNGETIVIAATAVINAAGGFGANLPMVVEHNANFAAWGTVAHPGNQGEGILIAQAIGAAVTHMENMVANHVVEPILATLHPGGLRNNGGIIVNRAGERIVNELAPAAEISSAMTSYSVAGGRAQAFVIFDARIREAVPAIETHINMDLVAMGDTIADLARAIGVDAAALEATINRYNELVYEGEDADFERPYDSLYALEGPFYASTIIPALFGTLGGIVINTEAEVLRADGSVITGLFAAGEVTGGIHGFLRGSGHALMDATVFGRIAGVNAANLVEAQGGFTARTFVLPEELPAIPQVQGNFTNGVFEGSAPAHNGALTVSVTVEDNNIVAIDLVDHQETAFMYPAALNTVATHIIRNQSTVGVDIATGATITSFAIMLAVNNALAN